MSRSKTNLRLLTYRFNPAKIIAYLHCGAPKITYYMTLTMVGIAVHFSASVLMS